MRIKAKPFPSSAALLFTQGLSVGNTFVQWIGLHNVDKHTPQYPAHAHEQQTHTHVDTKTLKPEGMLRQDRIEGNGTPGTNESLAGKL